MGTDIMNEIREAIISADAGPTVKLVSKVLSSGMDPKQVVKEGLEKRAHKKELRDLGVPEYT
jgi:hypothetical protein